MEDTRTHVLAALAEIAPEIADEPVDPGVDLLEEYDLDSMDLLNLVAALEGRLGVTIPESDYPRLRTLTGAVGYLDGRMAHPTP